MQSLSLASPCKSLCIHSQPLFQEDNRWRARSSSSILKLNQSLMLSWTSTLQWSMINKIACASANRIFTLNFQCSHLFWLLSGQFPFQTSSKRHSKDKSAFLSSLLLSLLRYAYRFQPPLWTKAYLVLTKINFIWVSKLPWSRMST